MRASTRPWRGRFPAVLLAAVLALPLSAMGAFPAGAADPTAIGLVPAGQTMFTFVGKIDTGPQSRAIVQAVLALGRSLSVPVLAEGVETETQRIFLEQEGCAEMQGYLLGRPLAIGEYAHLTAVGPASRRAQRRAGFSG